MGEEPDVHGIEVTVAPHRIVIDPEGPRPIARARTKYGQVPFPFVYAFHPRQESVLGDHSPDHRLKSFGILCEEIMRQALRRPFISFVEDLGESGITGQLMEPAQKRIRTGRKARSRRAAEPEDRSEAVRFGLIEAAAISFLGEKGMKTPGIDMESEMITDPWMPAKDLL